MQEDVERDLIIEEISNEVQNVEIEKDQGKKEEEEKEKEEKEEEDDYELDETFEVKFYSNNHWSLPLQQSVNSLVGDFQ